jgi:tRNA1Val (adenine37-N6)-methyltransferase
MERRRPRPSAPGRREAAARAFFPRGLFQPEGSFRFSLDALLLASFLTPAGPGERLLDLGSGCGVVALGMLCRYPDLEVLALDVQPELVEAARINAARLGFAGGFTALCRDVAAWQAPPDAFTLVLANPPYRQGRRGRLPASPLRRAALFEAEDGLIAFCRAAEQAMGPDGRFGVVFPAVRLDDLLAALEQAGLFPTRLLQVRARPADPPMRVLAEAVKKHAGRTPQVCGSLRGTQSAVPAWQPPLTLYGAPEAAGALTEQALAFCPFLACNPYSIPA